MGLADGGGAGRDVELGEDALGVGAQGVQGDVELSGDLWSGEVGVQEPEDLDFAPAQRAGQCLFGRLPGC